VDVGLEIKTLNGLLLKDALVIIEDSWFTWFRWPNFTVHYGII